MTSAVLILNAGSSSIKFALYETERLEVLCRGAIDGIGSTPRFTPKGTTAVRLTEAPALPQPATHDNLTAWLLDMLRTRLPDVTITAAGHRVDAVDIVHRHFVEDVLGAPGTLHLQHHGLGARDVWHGDSAGGGAGGGQAGQLDEPAPRRLGRGSRQLPLLAHRVSSHCVDFFPGRAVTHPGAVSCRSLDPPRPFPPRR